MADLIIKIADNVAEIESAQRLRYEVFNLEFGRGLAASRSSGMDQDRYDSICDHLIVFDRVRGMAVGTNRLLLSSRLSGQDRFDSENEFDLTAIRNLRGEILEMGRACVHKNYRTGGTINMLWEGIARYVNRYKVAYIIGCPSIEQTDPRQVGEIYALLMRDYGAENDLRVAPLPSKTIPGLVAQLPPQDQERKIIKRMPRLIRGYLHVGMRICGEPAWDEDFGTVDFFGILPVAKIPQSYVRFYHLHQH